MPTVVEMPKLGLTMTEGTVVAWLKSEGETVEKGEPLFILETDKLTLEAEAQESGILGQILVRPGTTVPTGTAVGLILAKGENVMDPAKPAEQGFEPELAGGAAIPARPAPTAAPPGPPAAAPEPQAAKASPKAKRLAEHAGLNLTGIEGSGKGGRIMAGDVERALAEAGGGATAPAQQTAAGGVPPAAQGDEAANRGKYHTVPLTGIRGVIARHMSESAHTTAAVTTTTQADATQLVRLREALRIEWQPATGLAPSYNDLLVVIIAKALTEHPYMNAHLAGEEIHHMAQVNIGIAVDTGPGLVVPVIKSVRDKRLADIMHISRDLVDRARAGRLRPDDVHGGTFTLSNMGNFDVEASTPIINVPECAILGVGRIAPRPAVVNGELRVRDTVTLSLTYDHRAIDGAPAARFLERVKRLVEEPSLAFVR